MIFRPQLKDLKVIGFFFGKIILGLGLWFIIPMVTAIIFKEQDAFLDFSISFIFSICLGLFLSLICYIPKDKRNLDWVHGMVVVALSWVVAMFLGAIPMWLSGHWLSFLDACFDSMSGFATTGLTLAQDIDHISYSCNLWRHLIMFIGGQGIVIIVLSFLTGIEKGSYSLYIGEGREERILPNLIQTARFIWLVSFVYLVLGSLALAISMRVSGMPWVDSFFHGVCIFMAAFDTGGFSPQAQNILYYHSWIVEVVSIIVMFWGAISFSVHYELWTGNKKAIWQDSEMKALFISVITLLTVVLIGLSRNRVYDTVSVLFRKGFFHLISAHSGTGYSTIYPEQFGAFWAPLSILGLILAMGLGGCLGSTTGAIKMMRIILLFKSFRAEVKRLMFSDATVVVEKFHHIRDIAVDDKHVRTALIITFAFIMLYLGGALIGVYCGYQFLPSLFESTSAAGNVGLSMGIVAPSMPLLLKITYMVQMWIGRLEFIAVFVLIGFVISWLKGK
ncbi:MAG: TrkH family potassium uptake protein [Candidatus Omnitrophica bacterium]|nr:TrkH family potassium uptake protein [Candidatus Omnitrophota bacterium]